MGRPGQIGVAIDAGVASAYFLLIYQGVMHLAGWGAAIEFFAALLLVFLGIYRFLEPLLDHLRGAFGMSSEHAMPTSAKQQVRFWALGIIVVTGFLHGVMHDAIAKNPFGFLGGIVALLILPGGITYSWISGTQHSPSRAAFFGGMTGAAAGFLFFFSIWVLAGGKFPFANEFHAVSVGDMLKYSLTQGLYWGMIGFAGGWAVDKRWGLRRSRSVALSIVGTVLLASFLCHVFLDASLSDILGDIIKVFGWALGLAFISSADKLLEPQAT